MKNISYKSKYLELCKIQFLSQGSNGKVYLFTEKPKTMNKKPQYKKKIIQEFKLIRENFYDYKKNDFSNL